MIIFILIIKKTISDLQRTSFRTLNDNSMLSMLLSRLDLFHWTTKPLSGTEPTEEKNGKGKYTKTTPTYEQNYFPKKIPSKNNLQPKNNKTSQQNKHSPFSEDEKW
jgi:hypothetical protein